MEVGRGVLGLCTLSEGAVGMIAGGKYLEMG